MATSSLPQQTSHLRRIAYGIHVPAVKGTLPLELYKKLFPGYFDEDWGHNWVYMNQRATPTRSASIFEVSTDGDFQTILGSFGRELWEISWASPYQMFAFLQTGGERWLHFNEHATYLPFVTVQERIALDVAYERKFDKDRGGMVDLLQAHYCRFTKWNRTLYRELGYRFAVLEPV